MNHDPLYDLTDTARRLGLIAAEAGRLLAAVTDRASGHRTKDDGSPTTRADLESERLILARLAETWPGIPTVAEESGAVRGAGELFFLVDPLDGTRDYLAGDGEYSVNIALVSGRRPVAAALAGPTAGRVWAAGRTAEMASMEGDVTQTCWSRIACRPGLDGGLVALVSRRHGDSDTEECLARLKIGSRRVTSSALKFCLVASGEADLYVRCGPTMEWDTAAGDHILTRAGGAVFGPAGALTYGHAERGFRNGPFAAVGDPALASRIALPVGRRQS